MKFGFSDEAFGNLLVCSGLTGVLLMVVVYIVAYKRGRDVLKHSFLLPLLLSMIVIFIIFPFWLSDLPIKWKFIGTILVILGALGNYFAIDRMQRALRKNDIKKNKTKSKQ